jgi:hypothetical protein
MNYDSKRNALRELIEGMKRSKNLKGRRRQAFSLIAVLIIAIAGLALVGGILYTFQAFSGASRQAMSASREYNLLQEAVEQGKALVRERMLARNPDEGPLMRKSHPAPITTLEDLLIQEPQEFPIDKNGLKGTLKLYIYAMDYTSDDVAGLSDSEKALLPPSLILLPDGGEDPDAGPGDL